MLNQTFAATTIVFKRDLTIFFRHRSETLNPLLFFLIIAALFPLATTSDPAQLATLGPGIIWMAALLATLLALENLYRSDLEDGSIEQLALSPYPLAILLLGKIAAHWMVTALPLILLSPLLAAIFHLPKIAMLVLPLSLLLGTPILSMLGAIASVLTVGLRQGGMLLALLLLPLYVPVLIFGANAVNAAVNHQSASAALYFLGAMLVLAITLAPMAMAWALRISIS